LYSDSLGNPGTAEEQYIGTFRANIDTIVKGLQ
jgi:ABC-type Zn uptake system ZnuABC Zn-binding protein ZnuA